MSGFGQFCPVAKTSELIGERWMPLILRELMCGSSRFSEIQRGVPLISPALLSKRLTQLETARVITRTRNGAGSRAELTEAGWELYPIIEAMGVWGQRWARSSYSADELDPALLMWDMRRMLKAEGLRPARTVVEFRFRQAPARKSLYWLVVDGDVDLCMVDPGLPIDLHVNANLRALTEVWMGDRLMSDAVNAGLITMDGPLPLLKRFPDWIGCHPVLGSVRSAMEAG